MKIEKTSKVTTRIRRQLTLFTQLQDSENIEKIRQQFNPRQSELIKSHVTLCREEEIENHEHVIANLHRLTNTAITINFGEAERFDNEKGALLPATYDNIEFHELRRKILLGIDDYPKKHEPHITLMHPRNSICTDDIFRQIKKKIAFKT